MSSRNRRKPLERIQTPVAPRKSKRTRFPGLDETENVDRMESTPKCSNCRSALAAQGDLCVECIAIQVHVSIPEVAVIDTAESTPTHRLSTIVEETAVERLQRDNIALKESVASLTAKNIQLIASIDKAREELVDRKDRHARLSLLYEAVYADSQRMEKKIKELLAELGEPEPSEDAPVDKEAKASAPVASPEEVQQEPVSEFLQ